jgi:hypothetical protein
MREDSKGIKKLIKNNMLLLKIPFSPYPLKKASIVETVIQKMIIMIKFNGYNKKKASSKRMVILFEIKSLIF